MLLASCQDDWSEGRHGGKLSENEIAFVIGGNTSSTRAAMQTVVAPSSVIDLPVLEEGETPLSLVETVTSLDETCYDAIMATRGIPAYTENFDALYGNDLYVTAYNPDGVSGQVTDVWGSYLENGGTVKYNKIDENTYAYDYTTGKSVNLGWPSTGSKSLMFFLQAPYTTTNALSPKFYADGHIEFDYTSPANAEGQTDFLFTSKLLNESSKKNPNKVLLYHALTGVKFKFGNVDQEVKTTITKVTLKGLTSNGHCTITPNYKDGENTADGNKSNKKNETNAATKSAACSVWTPASVPATADYVLVPNGVVDQKDVTGDFAESFYADGTADKNLNKADMSQTFFLIPQELKDVEVVVDFKLNDKAYQRTVKLNAKWLAGELHTYTLTVNKVDVAITDTMNEAKTEKTGVTTQNTGNVTAYLRATTAIAWYYGYGENATIVAPYAGQGIFMTGDNEGFSTKWIQGDDGFLYYPYPVMPGRATQYALFTSFTAPAVSEEAPFPGAHLELKILLQGVQFDTDGSKDRVTKAWGTVKDVATGKLVVEELGTEPENSKR